MARGVQPADEVQAGDRGLDGMSPDTREPYGHGSPGGALWRRSSYSGTQGNCVEVASNLRGLVLVRDSKDPAGPKLLIGVEMWRGFIAGVRASLKQ